MSHSRIYFQKKRERKIPLYSVFCVVKPHLLEDAIHLNFSCTLHAKLKRINASSQYKISLRCKRYTRKEYMSNRKDKKKYKI